MPARKRTQDLILALDIGTSKICAVIARSNENSELEVLGLGQQHSSGVSVSGLEAMDETVTAIETALGNALAHMPGMQLSQAIIGIGGTYLKSVNTVGSVALPGHGRGINGRDVEKAINRAGGRSIPPDHRVLHAVPRWFRVDETPYIRDPLGMEGSLLEVDVHFIAAKESVTRNLARCVAQIGLDVEDIIVHSVASAEAVLSQEEKNTGVAVLDIGGETTSIAVYIDGALEHTDVIPIGGHHITRDINHFFQTSLENAENLKRYFGCAEPLMVDEEDRIEVIRFRNRTTVAAPRIQLCKVIEARVEQLYGEVIRSIRAKDLFGVLFGGIVLTGGGAMLEGMREKCQNMLRRETTIGYPAGVSGFAEVLASPSYATGIGLLHHAVEQRARREATYGSGFGSFIRQWSEWLREAI